MSSIYSSVISFVIPVGLTIGISDSILEALGVQNKVIKAIVFSIASYIVLTTIEKYKIYKDKPNNAPK